MFRPLAFALLLGLVPATAFCEEAFVTIQAVDGNRLAIVPAAEGPGGGRGYAAGPGQTAGPRGRGRFAGRGGATQNQPVIVTVPASAKITSAMRERRTFEFRVGAELAGGLRNGIFQNMQAPLSARIVTDGNRITEVNVVTDQTDINQSNTDAAGQAVIAVRPKRPPMKSN